MLTALELENFKAFGARTRVELAPITLIFGQNSAGKSSILNALNLLKQTRMSREQGALLLPRAEGGLVDLGSFHELLHDHDLDQTLSIRVDVTTPTRRGREASRATPSGFEVGFHRHENRSDVTLAFLQAYAGGHEPMTRFEPHTLSTTERRSIPYYPYQLWRGYRQFSPRDIKAATCVYISEEPKFWQSSYDDARRAQQELVRALEEARDSFKSPDDESISSDRVRRRPNAANAKASFDAAIAFYSSDFSLAAFIARRIKAETGARVILDGFLPLYTHDENHRDDPEALALEYHGDRRLRLRWPNATRLIVDAGRQLEVALERLFPLGPFRRAPKRLYIFTGTTPIDVGYAGNLLPDLLYRRPELVSEANSWLESLDIGYQIEITPVGTPSNDLFELRLRDTRRQSRTSVALPDVGFGISQILPLVVQTLASEEQTITIEQPEVHIHPKLQADLGDLLVAGIQEPRRHQFIIETHSEHLVLRLLRRIRETTEGQVPADRHGLRPDQLSVVYLERGPDGTKVHHLRVDERGEFIDRWPHGFFEERAEELF